MRKVMSKKGGNKAVREAIVELTLKTDVSLTKTDFVVEGDVITVEAENTKEQLALSQLGFK